jgi:hypothetical protein
MNICECCGHPIPIHQTEAEHAAICDRQSEKDRVEEQHDDFLATLDDYDEARLEHARLARVLRQYDLLDLEDGYRVALHGSNVNE